MRTSGTETMKSYLLGSLEEPRKTQLEESLLSDGELFEELLISEDELVDQYVADRLTDAEKAKFESHFLITPDRHRKFQFGRTLNKYLEINDAAELQKAAPRKRRSLFAGELAIWPLRRPLMAFSLIAAICVASLVMYWIAARQSTNSNQKTHVVSLIPGTTRSEGRGLQRVSIPPGTTDIELRVAVPEIKYQSYSAELLSEAGKVAEIRSFRTSQENGDKLVSFSVEAKLLPPDDYQVKLSGIGSSGEPEFINDYSFGILKR